MPVALLLVATAMTPVPSAGPLVGVIVTGPDAAAAARAVDVAGGEVDVALPLIDGVSARLSAAQMARLERDGAVAVAPDRPVTLDAKPGGGGGGSSLKSVYTQAIEAPRAWKAGYRGTRTAAVALLDSGIASSKDLTSPTNRITGWVDFVDGATKPVDPHGHGTYLAGLVAGNGTLSSGAWTGVAPDAAVVGIRVFDATGVATTSRIVQGIQWAVANRSTHSIRVLTMAFSTAVTTSYKTDVIAYAAEAAWRAGIVVIASAGNLGPLPGTVASPGVDPFLVTVGAADDRGTSDRADDAMASWSGSGPTLDGYAKPDLVAPGVWDTGLRVVGSTVDLQHPLSVRDVNYFDGSGTSPATAVVAGVVALMLHKRPSLSPDQVKYVLTKTTSGTPTGSASQRGAGLVNAYRATVSSLTARANAGLLPSIGGGVSTLLGVPDVKWR